MCVSCSRVVGVELEWTVQRGHINQRRWNYTNHPKGAKGHYPCSCWTVHGTLLGNKELVEHERRAGVPLCQHRPTARNSKTYRWCMASQKAAAGRRKHRCSVGPQLLSPASVEDSGSNGCQSLTSNSSTPTLPLTLNSGKTIQQKSHSYPVPLTHLVCLSPTQNYLREEGVNER